MSIHSAGRGSIGAFVDEEDIICVVATSRIENRIGVIVAESDIDTRSGFSAETEMNGVVTLDVIDNQVVICIDSTFILKGGIGGRIAHVVTF